MQKKQLSKEVSMLNVLSFFFIYRWSWLRVFRRSHVSMLNVLSFFFIETIWHPVMIGDVFRCSMFWAFSLCTEAGIVMWKWEGFRCSIFWAFSLWCTRLYITALELSRFDAQCSELFLYDTIILYKKISQWKVSMLNVLSFFFIRHAFIFLLGLSLPFRCSMFWAFSLFNIYKMQKKLLSPSFDAQHFELFLYARYKTKVRILQNRFRCSMFWAFSLY